jgi:hypothetical protein
MRFFDVVTLGTTYVGLFIFLILKLFFIITPSNGLVIVKFSDNCYNLLVTE